MTPYKNSNQKGHHHMEPFHPKRGRRGSAIFQTVEQTQQDTQKYHGMFTKEGREQIKQHGFIKTANIHLHENHPILLKCILIFGFPLFAAAIFLLFLVAQVCALFTGMFIMVQDSYKDLGCLAATILLPGAIIIGGIGGAFFPWVLKRFLLQIHYQLWFEFAQFYFGELFSICC